MNPSATPSNGSSSSSSSSEPTDKALPAEADRARVEKQSGQEAAAAAGPPSKSPGNEEPAFALEPDLPSDGRDEEGEAMIRALPQRTELAEPASQPSSPRLKP